MPRKKKVVDKPKKPAAKWIVIDKLRPRLTKLGYKVVERGLTLQEAAEMAAEDDQFKIVGG